VTGNGSVGGLVGQTRDGTVLSSYAVGAVTGATNVGGLVGKTDNDAAVTDSYWDLNTTGQAGSAGNATGLATDQLKGSAVVSLAGFDFTDTWTVVADIRRGVSYPYLRANAQQPAPGIESRQPTGPYAGGNGTAADPYRIATWTHLDNVRQNLDANFTLVADLTELVVGYDVVADSSANNGSGFAPIGNGSSRFTGTFNGANHTIADLRIDRPDSTGVGLLGATGTGAVIENVSLDNATVRGNNTVGALAAVHDGTVRSSSVTGAVTGTRTVGGLVAVNNGTVASSSATVTGTGVSVGGLVGLNRGAVRSSSAAGRVTGDDTVGGLVADNDGGTVVNSSETATVTGTKSVGGLVGEVSGGTVQSSSVTGRVTGDIAVGGLVGNHVGGTVRNSSTTGRVTGTESVGGLVGVHSGSVRSSFATGNVSGEFAVGGLAGQNDDATVTNSYATGAVTGTESVGGLVGSIDGGTVESSYATGGVTGNSSVGGLVGGNDGGTVELSYATGGVTDSGVAVGGLVGTISGGAVESSYATGNVAGNSSVGGLVGGNDGGTVASSYAVGSVTSSGFSAGGLVGKLFSDGSVESSYATGNVTGDSLVGGLVGDNNGTVASSYATGNVTGSQEVGGLVGFKEGTVESSYWDLNTTGQDTSDGGTGLTTSQMNGVAVETNMTGFDFTGTWDVLGVDEVGAVSYPFLQTNTQRPAPGRTIETYAGGEGTSANPYQISNWYHLSNTRANLDANFTLLTDLNRSTVGYGAVADPTANNNSGFVPIGNNSNRFSGTFDGNNNSLAGLSVDRPQTDKVGLFGVTGASGVIKNVTLANATVRGAGTVGGLVGSHTGTVTGVSITGTVIGSAGSVGGLAGENIAGTVKTSSAAVTVSGDGQSVGGLVGFHLGVVGRGIIASSSATGSVNGFLGVGGLVGASFGTVRSSYATGNVTGESWVGGLVGDNDDETIASSYATGAVTGESSVGGLVGLNDRGTLTETYATGNVTGNSYAGGLVGDNFGRVQSSYWDLNTTGQATSSGGTGLTTAQMKGSAATRNMAGLKFTTTWQVVPGGYPALAGVEPVGPPPVVGDAAPTDPDNDGRYEDVNGRNGFNIIDVQALFNNLGTAKLNNNTAAFDFFQVRTGVDILDVQELFDELDASG
jgi:hypothetical protein